MKYTINPYALVVKNKNNLQIINSNFSSLIEVLPDEVTLDMLNVLFTGESVDYEVLCEVFSKDKTDELIKQKSLTAKVIDTESMLSRTNAFFETYNMPNAREVLSSKKVLVLGCGGIGTHLAWHMASLGVGSLTLLDFDTVEASNLNRQLMFDNDDVGKVKVEVLKEKLSRINEVVEISTICKKINSKKELEDICTAENYDLIIKALDSPSAFPMWLDEVAKEHNLTYISGITMRDNALIGPTHIPHQSKYGWNELLNVQIDDSEKLFGTAGSVGVMLYHISDELAIEAFKILTGYGKLKYVDQVLCKNILTNEEHVFQKEKIEQSSDSVNTKTSNNKELLLSLLLIITLGVASITSSWIVFVNLIFVFVLPFVLFKEKADILRSTFLYSLIFSFSISAQFLSSLDMSTTTEIISSILMLFSIHSAVAFLICLANFFVLKVENLIAK